MQHIKITVNFSQYKPFKILDYGVNLNDQDQLCRFIKTYYNQNTDNWKLEDFMDYHDKYQNVINNAIKTNNLTALEILWKGIYYHDRDNPNYENDVYVSAEYGNLETFQHILYAYLNYNTLDELEPLLHYKLQALSLKNKELNDYINQLSEEMMVKI